MEAAKTVAKIKAEEGCKERKTNKIVVACAFVWLIIGLIVLIGGVAYISYSNVIGSVIGDFTDDFKLSREIIEENPELYKEIKRDLYGIKEGADAAKNGD